MVKKVIVQFDKNNNISGVWKNAHEPALSLDISKQDIIQAALGKQVEVAGYVWLYVFENEEDQEIYGESVKENLKANNLLKDKIEKLFRTIKRTDFSDYFVEEEIVETEENSVSEALEDDMEKESKILFFIRRKQKSNN